MTRLARLLTLALVGAAGCRGARPPDRAPAEAAATRYVRGTLVRSDGSVLEDAVVVVEGNRIARVGAARDVPVPPRADAIGGEGRWIVAGLIDAHVHFFQSGGLYTRPDVVDLTARVPYAVEASRVREELPQTLRRYLRAGITSVVDFGGPGWNFDLRDLAARTALAPRVAVAGPLLSPVSRPQLDAGDPPILQVVDPAVARAVVREQAMRRPDFVKLWWRVGPSEGPGSWEPVARAAIEEAHARGLRVAVHATQLEVARAALRCGADVLVHGIFDADVDDEFLGLMRERNVPYVTTVGVFGGYQRVLDGKVRLGPAEMELASPAVVATAVESFPAVDSPYRRSPGSFAARNVVRAWNAGVLVVAGSDAGNIGTFHAAALHRELEQLVEAGLTPAQALTAATSNAARLMGRSDLGAVEPKRLADLVVLTADPLTDVRNARRIEWIMKDGVPRRPEDVLPRTAADVVQAQVNAYNAQDLEAFLSTYSDDATMVRAATGETLNAGKASLRDRYRTLFGRFPTNRVRIAERRTEGTSVVLDHEIITGRSPERPDPWDVGWVRYEVEGGLIRRVVMP